MWSLVAFVLLAVASSRGATTTALNPTIPQYSIVELEPYVWPHVSHQQVGVYLVLSSFSNVMCSCLSSRIPTRNGTYRTAPDSGRIVLVSCLWLRPGMLFSTPCIDLDSRRNQR
jgi:hypothetical protein